MGFLDNLKKKAPGLKDKAADLAATHGDKIDQGIDKAADLGKKATKGKYDAKIDDAAGKARNAADKLAEDDRRPPGQL